MDQETKEIRKKIKQPHKYDLKNYKRDSGKVWQCEIYASPLEIFERKEFTNNHHINTRGCRKMMAGYFLTNQAAEKPWEVIILTNQAAEKPSIMDFQTSGLCKTDKHMSGLSNHEDLYPIIQK